MDQPTVSTLTIPDDPRRLLIAEDREDVRESLQLMLEVAFQMPVDSAVDGEQALEMLRERPYSILVTDLQMPRRNGLELIEAIRDEKLNVTVIVTTGKGGVVEAVEAMRHGASDFLVKPADPQHLCMLIRRALDQRGLKDEVAALRMELNRRHSFQNILSKSQRMTDVFDLIANIADTSSTVLILGETGTKRASCPCYSSIIERPSTRAICRGELRSAT